jgi:predicted nucleic acid-binding protein
VILLDTNVLSALMQQEADSTVVAWLDAQPAESIWTTSITVFEIRFGLKILPNGRRRRRLEEAFARALAEDFEGRAALATRKTLHSDGLGLNLIDPWSPSF